MITQLSGTRKGVAAEYVLCTVHAVACADILSGLHCTQHVGNTESSDRDINFSRDISEYIQIHSSFNNNPRKSRTELEFRLPGNVYYTIW